MSIRLDIETLNTSLSTLLRMVGRISPSTANRLHLALEVSFKKLQIQTYRTLLRHVVIQLRRIDSENIVLRLNVIEMIIITVQRAAVWVENPVKGLAFEIFMSKVVRSGLDFIKDGLTLMVIRSLFITLNARNLWILIKHRREFKKAYKKLGDKRTGSFKQRRNQFNKDVKDLGLGKKENLALVGIFVGSFLGQGGVKFSS